MARSAPADFEQELADAVERLRASLIRAFDELGLDAHAPQDLARKLGLNKTLTWNISRLVRATSHIDALPHIPGEQSFGKLAQALARCGAPESSAGAVRQAIREFKAMTVAHVGDRSSLDLVVGNLAGDTSDPTEQSRKLAFRGNSGLYGIQARTRAVSYVVVPNALNPARLDVAFLTGFVGLRRLRAKVRWPIFKLRTESNPAETTDLWPPGSPADAHDLGGPRCFYRGSPPTVEIVNSRGDRDCVLMPGAVGDSAAFDCFSGDVFRAAVPRFQTRPGETGDFGAAVTVPSEHLVLDLIVHKDLPFALHAKVMVFSTTYAVGEADRPPDDDSLLPIHVRPVPLIGSPLAVATPRVPRYTDFFQTMHERLGFDPADLRGIRVELKYPPLGSMVLVRYALPPAPTDSPNGHAHTLA